MPLFRYKALSAAGEALDGQMEAASADEVITRLQDQGHLPVEARRADQAGGAARTDRTKVLLFCSPSNPTGAVYPPEQVEAIGRWALEHGIWVVTDEIYEHLLYDGAQAPSMPVVVPELADTCVVLNGVAKTYAMTGWRVGWVVGPADVVKSATNLQSHATSNVANVSQAAAIAALMSARIASHLGPQAAESFGSGEGSAAGGPAALPPAIAEALSSAFAESLLLPAAVLVIGALAALELRSVGVRAPTA